MPYLLETLDGEKLFCLQDTEGVYLIGRMEDCDIRLDSRKVSRRHCCVALVEDYLAVRDLGSTNGIRINGQEVLEGRLSHGDTLSVGPFVFRVIWQREQASASVAARSASAAELQGSPHQRSVVPHKAPVGDQLSPGPSSPAKEAATKQPDAVSPPPQKAKKMPLLEDSSFFKMLEMEDPLRGGG